MIEKSPWTTTTLTECVINLSSVDLTVDQMRVLGLGLSFHQNASAPSVVSAMSRLHLSTYSTDPCSDGGVLRGAVMSGILELLRSAPVLPRRYRLAVSSLRNDSSITILPADKGSRIVVIDHTAYIQAAEEMLSDERVYKKLRTQAPLETRIPDYNNELENLQKKLPNDQNGKPSTLLNKFMIKERSCARTAYAYFTPKDHKPHPPSSV